jgi:hypothetical protein
MDTGAFGELFQEGKRLITPNAPPVQIRIDIPVTHPMAAELRELAAICANRQKHPSGLEVVGPPTINGTERMYALLERMGVDTKKVRATIAADAKSRNTNDDLLLKTGLGLLTAAAGVTGQQEKGKILADKLARDLAK